MLPIARTLAEKELEDSFSIKYCDNRCYEPQNACRLSYNRVLLIKTGNGHVIIDENTFALSSNGLFLIAKGQIISFQPGSVFTGYDLSFGDCFWQKAPESASNCKAVLFNNASANQFLALSNDDYDELSPLFDALHKEFLKDAYINKLDAMAAYLKIIMIKMANINASMARGFDSYENKLYRRFLELISHNYRSSHEVADYARMLAIPARKLAELSRRCSGKGAKDLINGQLMAEAKRSLQFSSSPVKEIAFDLNFSSPEQFSHFFKKNAQLSPQDYRMLFVNSGL
jgi:AraC family transcriptional activator of pobA